MTLVTKRLRLLDTLFNEAVNHALGLTEGTAENAQGIEEIYCHRIAIRGGIIERALLRGGIALASEGGALKLDQRVRELEARFSMEHSPTLWRDKRRDAKRETERVITSFLFLDGEPLEFVLSDSGILSDEGRAYDAVRVQTDHCDLSPEVLEQRAMEIIPGLGVEYHRGVFFVEGVTEDELQEAVSRLANALLLFYGMAIGACRALKKNEREETPKDEHGERGGE